MTIESDPELDPSTLKRRSSQGAAITFAAQGVKFVVKVGGTVLVARLLSPAEFGVVAMAAPVLGFVSALNDMGFAQAIIRNRDLTGPQISSLFWLNLLLSSGLTLGLLIASPFIAMIYREPQVTPVLAALSSILVIGTLSLIPSALLARQMRFAALTAIDLAGIGISTGVTLWAAWAGLSYWALIVGQLAGALVTAVMAFATTRWAPQAPAMAPGAGDMARFGANLTGVGLASYLSMTADNIIVGAVAGKVALGFYDRSYALVVQPLGQLIAPLNRVALPLLARLRDTPERYRSAYVQMLRLSLLLTLPAMLFCVAMAKPLLMFLWGPRWAPAIPIFFWFSVGGLVAPIFSTTGWLFVTEGRTDRQLRLALATALISIVSFLIGIPWGATGVVLVNAFSFTLLQTPLMVWGASKDGLVRLRDFADALAPLVLPFIVTLLALIGLGRFVSGWWTAPTLGAAYGVFGLSLFILPNGRALIGATLDQLRSLVERRRGAEASA